MNPKRALVLGATSYVGESLCRSLHERGVDFTCLSRRPRAPEGHDAWKWRQLDIAAPNDERIDAELVVSLAPVWLVPVFIARVEGLRQVIALSSTSATSKEKSLDPAERALAFRLASGERGTLAAAARAGASCTILRPTLIYAPGKDRNVTAIANVIRRFGCFPVARPGGGLRQPVHCDDVAAAAIAAIDNRRAAGQTFALPGGERLRYHEMVARIFRALGRRPAIIPVPAALLRAAASLAKGVGAANVSPALFDRMNEDLVFDGRPAEGALGYRPRPFELPQGAFDRG